MLTGVTTRVWYAAFFFLISAFLIYSPGMVGQEGTITLLSAGEKLTILHNSEVVSSRLSHPSDQTSFGTFKTHALEAGERVMALYPGSTRAPHRDHLATLMNASGYDAAGLGRFELSWSKSELIAHLRQVQFPYVAANLQIDAGSALADRLLPFETVEVEALRSGGLGGWLYPGLVIEDGDLETCVFGLVDDTLQPQLSNPALSLTDPVEAAQAMVKTCEESGSQLVIALLYLAEDTHLDSTIKQQVPGIDVFVVGGSNERFDPEQNPDAHLMQTPKGLSLSVQTNEGHNLIGVLGLTVSSNRIFEFSYRQVSLGQANAAPGRWMLLLGLGLLAVLGFFLFKGQ